MESQEDKRGLERASQGVRGTKRVVSEKPKEECVVNDIRRWKMASS